MNEQFNFDFTASGSTDGLATWRAQREREVTALCARLGMPVDHAAEVTLAQGPVLRGTVRIAEETLWLEGRRHEILLRIGETTFTICQVESAIRL